MFFRAHLPHRLSKSFHFSFRFVVGHISPEAQDGGPLAFVKNGDQITIDAERNSIDVKLSSDELHKRKSNWIAPELKVKRGALYKYASMVSSAS